MLKDGILSATVTIICEASTSVENEVIIPLSPNVCRFCLLRQTVDTPPKSGLAVRGDFYPRALDKIDGGIEDHVLALLHPVAHLDLGPKIAGDIDFAQVNDTALHHGHTHASGIEDDGVRRHGDIGSGLRNVKFNGAIDSRLQHAIRVRDIDFR